MELISDCSSFFERLKVYVIGLSLNLNDVAFELSFYVDWNLNGCELRLQNFQKKN